jgi:hypothetical protein
MVSPAGTAGVACCRLCVDHGIFNHLATVELTAEKWKPFLDFLTKHGVPFRILDTIQGAVEFYPKQEPDFLEKLATFIK